MGGRWTTFASQFACRFGHDDPERDWEIFYRQAVEYQFGKYSEWAGGHSKVGVKSASDTPWKRKSMLVDTPENIARRLRAIRARAPHQEFVFWHRFPLIGHERALEHLEFVADRVIPLLSATAEPHARLQRQATAANSLSKNCHRIFAAKSHPKESSMTTHKAPHQDVEGRVLVFAGNDFTYSIWKYD
jgi:hypothetical protein